jgi:hypothetical protein
MVSHIAWREKMGDSRKSKRKGRMKKLLYFLSVFYFFFY